MKFIKYSVVFLIVFIVEISLIDIISIKGITPDIILIFLIFVSLKESQTTATLSGFGTGLFQDLFSFSMLGLYSLSKSISCFLTSYFQRSKGHYSIANLAVIFL